MPTRLLAIGDVHLGRTSSRLPARLDAAGLGPAAALRRAVAAAIEHEVSAVLLAGDLADSTRDQYHALGVLTEVLGPLGEAGIEVVAVAGNHDHEVLPRLEGALPGLSILGAGGRWEVREVRGPGGPVRILGWSFPEPHYRRSPAAGLERLADGPPVVGLLHADLDAATGGYAPVRRHELAAAGPCRWLLGHIHQPSLEPVGREPGYLGSLVGLDPTETGPRGPWLVEVERGEVALRFLPLAPLRWQRLAVPVDGVVSARDELLGLVMAAVRGFAADHAVELAETAALGLRLDLVGRTADLRGLAAAAAELAGQREVLSIAPGLAAFVDRITSGARPARDLDALSARNDPLGLLARELCALQDGTAGELLDEARQAAGRVDGHPAYRALALAGDADLADAALAELLLREGYRLLDEMAAGREGADGAA